MDTTLFLVLLASVLLIVAAFVAWRRYRSRRALMRQVRELQALAEAGRAIAEARLDADELCDLIYQHASAMMDTANFQLGLFDGLGYNIRLWVRAGERVPPQGFDLSDNPGSIGWVRQSRQPLLVHDFEQELDRLPAQPRYFSEEAPRSAVFVPLVARDQAIGALAIQSFRPEAFTENHTRRLSIIATKPRPDLDQPAANSTASTLRAVGARDAPPGRCPRASPGRPMACCCGGFTSLPRSQGHSVRLRAPPRRLSCPTALNDRTLAS